MRDCQPHKRSLSNVVCVVLMLCFHESVSAGDLLTFVQHRVQSENHHRIVNVFESLSDCPLLPGCPSGPWVPLPPTFEDQPESEKAVNSRDSIKIADGVGKYADMLFIPSGPSEMGSTDGEGRVDERPRHKVFLRDFYVAKHLVTVKQYCDFLNNRGDNSREGLARVKLDSSDCPLKKKGGTFLPKPGYEDKPMVCVSWQGAVDYASWAGGRLPTSAEWEKVASLTTLSFPKDSLRLPDELDSESTHSVKLGVGGFTALLGNVWQWCSDWYSRDYYSETPPENPEGPPLGTEKIIRGGSWASPDASRRIQNLHRAFPRGYYRTVGFRIVKD